MYEKPKGSTDSHKCERAILLSDAPGISFKAKKFKIIYKNSICMKD